MCVSRIVRPATLTLSPFSLSSSKHLAHRNSEELVKAHSEYALTVFGKCQRRFVVPYDLGILLIAYDHGGIHILHGIAQYSAEHRHNDVAARGFCPYLFQNDEHRRAHGDRTAEKTRKAKGIVRCKADAHPRKKHKHHGKSRKHGYTEVREPYTVSSVFFFISTPFEAVPTDYSSLILQNRI